jgi:glucose dehydrogenase
VNWGGGGVEPDSSLYVVNVLNLAHFVQLTPREAIATDVEAAAENMMGTATPILGTEVALKQEPMMSPSFTPCSPPPWAMLVAVDLQAGTIVWRSPLGVLDKMMPMALPLRWGAPTFGGPLLTGGGLTFIGATADNRFRAFVTATGEEIWSVELPSGAFALPMTYEQAGRQFVVIASGPHPFFHPIPGDHITAFALPLRE